MLSFPPEQFSTVENLWNTWKTTGMPLLEKEFLWKKLLKLFVTLGNANAETISTAQANLRAIPIKLHSSHHFQQLLYSQCIFTIETAKRKNGNGMKYRYWLTALAVIILDQGTKWLSRTLIEPMVLIPGVVQLHLVKNTGVAFSLLSRGSLIISAAAVILLLFLRRWFAGILHSPAADLGYSLVLGGALSNLLSRVILGYVPDMIELLFVSFAIFNLADIAVVCGAAVMFIAILLEKNGEADP